MNIEIRSSHSLNLEKISLPASIKGFNRTSILEILDENGSYYSRDQIQVSKDIIDLWNGESDRYLLYPIKEDNGNIISFYIIEKDIFIIEYDKLRGELIIPSLDIIIK